MIVPFIEYLGIDEERLECAPRLENHLGSIHAGVQFTFAERASGVYLASLFPDIKDGVIPLLRESSMKYKKQALSTLKSEVRVGVQALDAFRERFEKKGRALITVEVILKDSVDEKVCEGSFKWFIERRE